MRTSKLSGWGMALPDKVVTNADLEAMLDTSDEWIRERSGIRERRIGGTTSGLAVNLEECSGCGVSAWGWEDDGWGAVDRNGVRLRFPAGGRQDILIQVREDGVSIDQVVLSAEKYLTARPGAAKNDHTLLPRTYQVNPH